MELLGMKSYMERSQIKAKWVLDKWKSRDPRSRAEVCGSGGISTERHPLRRLNR